jgi:hypothetical protein
VASSFARSEPNDFYLWGTLNDKLYRRNARNEDDLKEGIQDAGSYISSAELQCATNMSLRFEVLTLVLLKIQVF